MVRNPPKKTKLTATIHDMTCRLMPELHTAANIQGRRELHPERSDAGRPA